MAKGDLEAYINSVKGSAANYHRITIEQEIKKYGITNEYFEKFYKSLVKENYLPPKDIVPQKQYRTIVDYLKSKKVLGENNRVLAEGLKIFRGRRRLEDLLKDMRKHSRDIGIGSSGGIAPCIRRPSLSSGGIAPCID